ncbi:MAG: hypothetical protein ACKO26_17780, partial [Planctomycetota bacterium]
TQDAIHSGISSAISGAISNYMDAYPDYEFLVLGGDAESIMAIMKGNTQKQLRYVPDCIARGIFADIILALHPAYNSPSRLPKSGLYPTCERKVYSRE